MANLGAANNSFIIIIVIIIIITDMIFLAKDKQGNQEWRKLETLKISENMNVQYNVTDGIED